ncbi:hypothetical protein WA026_008210 [Henosepilachna vigintioctopunctata]|uniref:Uncharacterized protein n=1 Tax=Henosepilachna vigintioctopunctata TaxID=420089 RepID=A0AAW1TJX9_9CUCU
MSTTPMLRSFSTDSARKRDWKQRLSLRDCHRREGDNRKGCTRKWTSLKQTARGVVGQEPYGSCGRSTPSTVNTSPLPAGAIDGHRKSNWQVIEHFGSKDKSSLSSSLIAVGSVSRSSPMKDSDSIPNSSPEHEGKATEADMLVLHNRVNQPSGFSGKLKKFLRKFCGNLQFKNVQVEMLYQRYFLKMNQSNMTNLLSLLLILCVVLLLLAATDVVFMQQGSHSSVKLDRVTSKIGFNLMDKSLVVISTSGCCLAIYGGEL